MKSYSTFFPLRFKTLFLVIFLLPTFAFGATNLGSGYSCDDGKITRKGKVVKLAVARSAVDQQISKLPNSKAGKAKKAVLQALKKALKNCTTQAPVGGGQSVTSILGPRLLGDRTLTSTPITGFGSSAAFGVLQVKESFGGYLFSLSIGENTPLTERYFGDYEPGPFVTIPLDATVPYTASAEVGAPSMRSILIEATKVTLRWTNIKAGTTRNGANITEVKAVLIFADAGRYDGTLEYLSGTSVVASGTFTFQP